MKDELISLGVRVRAAEKKSEVRYKDTVTGRNLDMAELRLQMREENPEWDWLGKWFPEDKKNLEISKEFSRRRGYTEEEISELEMYTLLLQKETN